jgi:hypothetical protein
VEKPHSSHGKGGTQIIIAYMVYHLTQNNVSHDQDLVVLSFLEREHLPPFSVPRDLPSIQTDETSTSEASLPFESVAGWVGTDVMRLPSNQEDERVLCEVIRDQVGFPSPDEMLQVFFF